MGEELQSNGARKGDILGFVDDTHATFAKLLGDLRVGYCLAEQAERLLKHVLDKHEL